MAKNKRKKKRYTATPEEYAGAKASLQNSLRTFNWRLALLMLAIFALLAAIYYVLLALHVFWATPALYTLAAALFMVFFFVNRGFSRNPVSEEVLPEEWSPQQRRVFVSDDVRRKALGRRIMVILTPVLLLVMADMLILFVLPLFRA